jgi:NSS family neurotransmitter:Na+ symporter
MATIGAAVGLGNIWMFPYFTGMNGGGAFVLIYIFCVLLIGIPIMMAEALIGQKAQQNPVSALSTLAKTAKASRFWPLLGVWGAIGLVMTLSFYSVVSGWSLAYLSRSLQNVFANADATLVTKIWAEFMANPWELLLWHTTFMIMTMGVIVLGVQKGLERASKIMMPAFVAILLVLVCYSIFNAEFVQALKFLFYPDFSLITTKTVLSAMGIAFFSLALGAGCICAYASYVPKNERITPKLLIVAGFDTLLALLAGLAIFPLVFAYGLSPAEGPGLMFEVLPTAFAQMAAGQVLGALFFLLLLFAAWTSSISLAEPIIAILQERTRLTRIQGVWIIGSIAWLLGISVLLSFNHWAEIKILGFTFFDIATQVPIKIILPLGGLGFAIFAGWILSKQTVKTALQLPDPLFNIWRFLIRYISPLAILATFIYQL